MQLQLVVNNVDAWEVEFDDLSDERIVLIRMAASDDLNPRLVRDVLRRMAEIELRLMFLEYHLFCRR